MEISSSALRAKRSCASGYRWFARRFTSATEYQAVVDALLEDGRVDDACWLIDHFGPIGVVRVVDELSAEACVFPGSLQVRRGVDVDTVLRIGGSLTVGGGIRAGTILTVGGDLAAGGGIQAGVLRADGNIGTGWSIDVRQGITCGGNLRVRGELRCGAGLSVGGQAVVDGDLEARGAVDCTKSLRAGGHIRCGDGVRAGQGIQAAGDLASGRHIDAGWGVISGADIVAEGAIRVGESIFSGGEVRAGTGYGIHAGSSVRRDAWPSCGMVVSRTRPEGLFSGLWNPPRGTAARKAFEAAEDVPALEAR